MKCINSWLKRTVSIILSDSSCKDDNALFTTVPLKALSDQVWIKYPWFFNYLFSFAVSLQKWLVHFLFIRSNGEIIRIQLYSRQKRWYLPHFLSDKGFKGTVVNRVLPFLHRGSLTFLTSIIRNMIIHFSCFREKINMFVSMQEHLYSVISHNKYTVVYDYINIMKTTFLLS